MEYGIQMYSLRDVTPTDMENTLRRVAEMGYKTVEFAGLFDHDPIMVRRWLDENGLRAAGTHTPWEQLRSSFDETVRIHKILDCPAVVIPGFTPRTPVDLEAFIQALNFWHSKLDKEGLRLGYHNHSHEFLPNHWGCRMHRELQLKTDIELEIDTYWAWHAGLDPIKLMQQLGQRVKMIHIKDGLENGDGFPLGMGTAPVREVWDYARAHDLHMIVESETLQPDGLTEARICMEYLAALEN